MTDPIVPPTDSTTPPVTPPVTPPATGTPPATPTEVTVSMSSAAFAERLKEERAKERRAFLKTNGFEDEASFANAQKAAKEAADAKLTADEKAAKRIKELEPLEPELKKYKVRFEKDVAARFAALPADVQARITEEAGDDAEKRDAFMRVLGPSSAPAATPALKPPPANSSNAPPAPPSTGAPTMWDQYKALEAKNAGLAAIFFNANAAAIHAAMPANQ